MLLMVEKGIRGRIVHAIHRYAKANNEYMKNYGKNFESSYLEYLDEQFVWMGMSQTLPVNGSKWKKNVFKFEEDFIKNYDVDSDKGYILAVDGEYSKNLHDLHSDLPFLAEGMEINKFKKLVCNIYDKNNYIVQVRALKQALNCGLILKKVHRKIQFNQKAQLKPHIDMNNKLITEAKNDFEISLNL